MRIHSVPSQCYLLQSVASIHQEPGSSTVSPPTEAKKLSNMTRTRPVPGILVRESEHALCTPMDETANKRSRLLSCPTSIACTSVLSSPHPFYPSASDRRVGISSPLERAPRGTAHCANPHGHDQNVRTGLVILGNLGSPHDMPSALH